jgi:hypothetical protein
MLGGVDRGFLTAAIVFAFLVHVWLSQIPSIAASNCLNLILNV